MSWYINSFVTDAGKVQKVWGCKNKLFFEKALLKLKNSLDDLDYEYEDIVDFEKNAKSVLLDIVNGKISYKDLGVLYIHVYEELCGIFGEQIYCPNDEYSVPYFKALQLQQAAFLEIPTPKGPPFVHSILNKDLKIAKEYFLGMTKPEDMDEKTFAQEQGDYAFAFDKAMQDGLDLVFTMY